MPTIAPSGNGTHPSTKANMKNNYGVILNGGNISSNLARAISPATLADQNSMKTGSKLVELNGAEANTADRVGVGKALAAGTFGYQADGTKWIMRGGVTRQYNTVSGEAILNGSDWNGGVQEDFIYQTTSNYAVGSGDVATFDFYANPNGTIQPNYVKAGNAGAKVNYVRPSGTGLEVATDDAATTSRSVPGELTYRFGGALPKQDDYKRKDILES